MIIRKSNKIPVRQDGAGGIPPALGVEKRSRVALRAGAGSSTGSAPNNHPSISDHSPVSTKGQHELSHDAADGTVVMIGSPFARPFLWFPVHSLCAAPKAEPRASP